MFSPMSVGSTNYEERITRRDGGWTVLHRHAAAPVDAPVYVRNELGPRAPVEAAALDGSLTRRVFPFAKVPEGADPIAGRVPVLFSESATLAWVCADSASATTVFTDHDGDQLVCVLEGGATLDTPCGTLRANPAEHVFVPRGMPHRWKVDKLGLRALIVEARGEMGLPRAWRNDYGQLGAGAPFGYRDMHRPNWFSRPYAAPEGVRCTLRRGGETWDGTLPNDPLATVGWDGSVYPSSVAWEVPLTKAPAEGVELFVHERFLIRTRINREDGAPPPGCCDLVTLALDGEGAASLVWDPLGVTPRPAGSVGGIVVQVCARDPWRLTPSGALLMA